MSGEILIALGAIALLVSGIPVALALAIVGFVVSWIVQGQSAMMVLPQVLFNSVHSFLLVAIPLFVLMSEIMHRGGVIEVIYEMVNRWVGHLPGGLGVSTVLTAAIGAAITGSSVANAASMAIIAVKPMIARGYDKRFTYGLIAVSGTLGILIPPSIPMLLYGVVTGESVGKLFLAGIIPGLMVSAILATYVIFLARRGKVWVSMPKATMQARIEQTKKAFPGLMLPIIVIGGIYAGFFTPTEAAAAGVTYGLSVSAFWYRSLGFKDLWPILQRAIQTCCMIMLMIAGAMMLGTAITVSQIPQKILLSITTLNLQPGMFLIAVMVLLVGLGCVLEVMSIVLILMPVLYPIIMELGIDPIWFGVLFTVNMEIALMTPPVGMNLYVVTGIVKEPIEEVIRGVIPFCFIMFACLLILMAFPDISLGLGRLLKIT